MRQEPIAYINVEQRKLEFAKPIMWHTPTVVNLERIPLYTHQRTWVGLSEQQRNDIENDFEVFVSKHVFDAIEAKLKQKNGYVAQETNS